MCNSKQNKQSSFYIALRDGGIPGFVKQVVIGRVTKGWPTLNLLNQLGSGDEASRPT